MEIHSNVRSQAFLSGQQVGRGERSDAAAEALEAQSTRVAQLNETELAAYRTYGAQVCQDIDQVQACCGETPEGDRAEFDPKKAFSLVLQTLMQAMASGASPEVVMALIELAIKLLEEIIRQEGQGQDGKDVGTGEGGKKPGGSGGDSKDPGEAGDGGKKPGETGEGKGTEKSGDKDKVSADLSPVGAAKILLKYFDLLDTAAGKGSKDNLFTTADLESVSKNPDAPKELVQAVAYVLRNPMFLNAMDVGNKVDEVDGKFGIEDLKKFIEQHEGKEGYDKVDSTKKADETDKGDETGKTDETDKGDETGKTDETGETPKPAETEEAKEKRLALADVEALHQAMAGGGTNEKVLIDVLCKASNKRIDAIKSVYSEKYGQSLEAAVRQETSGDFRQTLLAVLQGRRDESGRVDQGQVKADAAQLHKAIAGMGTNEATLISVLTTRSREQLQAIETTYEAEYGESLVAAIKGDTSGDFRTALLALLGK